MRPHDSDPARPELSDDPRAAAMEALSEAQTHARGRLLVAEDNLVNQKVAVAMLAKLGYRADIVANGAEALEALSRNSYDAVLMDCQMPNMDGYSAAAEIRRREGGAQHVPIIAMTAEATGEAEQRSFAAGMDDYIAKPVKLEHLDAVLHRWTAATVEQRPGTNASALRASNAMFDAEKIAELRSLYDPSDAEDALANLVSSFLDNSHGRLNDVRVAAAAQDRSVVAAVAHDLAGVSAMFGARFVHHLARQLERAATSNPSAIERITDRLEVALDEVAPKLHEAVAKES